MKAGRRNNELNRSGVGGFSRNLFDGDDPSHEALPIARRDRLAIDREEATQAQQLSADLAMSEREGFTHSSVGNEL